MNFVMGYETTITGRWADDPRPSPTLVLQPVEESWRKATEQRLARLSKYRIGWDGYNSSPPQPSVVAYARSTLNSVMGAETPAPSIVPLSSGGLQLEWHTAGFDVELAIFSAGEAELSVQYPDDREPIEDQRLTLSLYRLSEVLEELEGLA